MSLCAWLALAWAGDGADSLFLRARQAEDADQYELALQLCEQLMGESPELARAQVCGRRVAFLTRRRDTDGSFSGWSALQQVRRTFLTTEPAQRERQVQQVWSSPTSSPATRAEAAIWLARAALERGAPEQTLSYTEDWLILREVLPEEEALVTQIGQVRAMALAELGLAEEAAALQAQVAVPVEPTAARPTPVEEILKRKRDQTASTLSMGALGLFVAGTSLPALRALRAGRLLPWGLLPIGLATGGTFVLAELWERGAGQAAPWMGLGFALVHLLSVGALRSADGRWLPAALVRLGAALATVAVTWLALWATDTLMWVGA
jgi:hypothetical protein